MASRKGRYGVFNLSNGGQIEIPFVDSEVLASKDMMSEWNDIDVHDVTTVQRLPVGTIMKRHGKTYAYTEFGGTTAAGDLLQAEIVDPDHDVLAPVAAVAGATEFEVTMPGSGTDDFIVNEYAGGEVYAQVNGSPGYSYHIARHDSGDISTTDTMTVVLAPGENLAVALAATDDLSFSKNPWKETIIHASPQTAIIVGVSLAIGADGSFGWLGVKGPHPVLTEGTVVVGYEVRPGETTDGTVTAQVYDEDVDADQGIVGKVHNVGGDGEFSLIDLNGFGLV